MDDVAIKVENVSKTFRLPHEKQSSIKSALINFKRGKKTYETQHALKDISFEIKKGEFFGIIGRNGSGKSTLLKLLAGIYSPTKGAVRVNGSLTPFIELGVGFNPELTGRENVFLNGALLGFNRKEMQAMYKDIVKFAELRKFMDQKLKNYSSGMQVRLAFSIAIRAKSDILLLDEVLAVGDAAFQQKCFNYFEELKAQHKTVVFVSHDMGAVRRFCNKAVYIENGNLTYEGIATEIADIYVENNLSSAPDENEESSVEGYKVTSKVMQQTASSVELIVSYNGPIDEETYVGIALVKDGFSVGEINTLSLPALQGKGRIQYSLDTSELNPGLYNVNVALFRHKNQELLSFSSGKNQFQVKGDDHTRGAAIRLKESWKQL